MKVQVRDEAVLIAAVADELDAAMASVIPLSKSKRSWQIG
jgi:hypothetical protein